MCGTISTGLVAVATAVVNTIINMALQSLTLHSRILFTILIERSITKFLPFIQDPMNEMQANPRDTNLSNEEIILYG